MNPLRKFLNAAAVLLVFLLGLLAVSCHNNPVGPDEGINPNIVQLVDCCSLEGGTRYIDDDYFMAVWRGDRIYTLIPLRELHVNDSLRVSSAREIWQGLIDRWSRGFTSFLDANTAGTKLLIVKSTYRDVSAGALYEYVLETDMLRLVRDSTYNISSAVYWPGDDTRIVYYSYGKPTTEQDYGDGAGYYLLNLATGRDSLLLAYLSPMGLSERLNGFDLHPDGTRLLVPAVQADRSTIRPPKVVEYDLERGTADTLAVPFDVSWVRIGLWLRYSPDGQQILYCNFPLGIYGDTTNDDSEVGLIERVSERKRVLDVNTNPLGARRSVQLAPTWSEDGRHIVYGSGPAFFPSGARGTFSLYVLQNVN